MTDLALSPRRRPGAGAGRDDGGRARRRIEVPRQLPPRPTMESRSGTCRIRSYALWVNCKRPGG